MCDVWKIIHEMVDSPRCRAGVRLAAFYFGGHRLEPTFSDLVLRQMYKTLDHDFLIPARNLILTHPCWPFINVYSEIHPEPYRRTTRLYVNSRIFYISENRCTDFPQMEKFVQFVNDLAWYCIGGYLDVRVHHIDERVAERFDQLGFERGFEEGTGHLCARLFVEAPYGSAIEHSRCVHWKGIWTSRRRVRVGFWNSFIIMSKPFLDALKLRPRISLSKKYKNWTSFYVGRKYKERSYQYYAAGHRVNQAEFVIERYGYGKSGDKICSIPLHGLESSKYYMLLWVHINSRQACNGFKVEVFASDAHTAFKLRTAKLQQVPDIFSSTERLDLSGVVKL